MLVAGSTLGPYRIPAPLGAIGRSVVILLVATLAPAVSLAQTAGDTTSIGASYDRMPPSLSLSNSEGRTIRVILGSRTLVCRSPRFTPAGIALAPSGPGAPRDSTPTLLPWAEVDRVDVRGNSALTGAIIGAVAVGLFATALGAAVASDPFLGKGTSAGDVLALTVVGAVTGAGAGALVGSAIPSWKNVYRRGVPSGAKSARP